MTRPLRQGWETTNLNRLQSYTDDAAGNMTNDGFNTYTYGAEGRYTSQPFGDDQTASGSDLDASHYATFDHDAEIDTDHAQFRQYSNVQGHWKSPDPYYGSYDQSKPQSLNRYSYVMNSPTTRVDPLGLTEQMFTVADEVAAAEMGFAALGGGAAAWDAAYGFGPQYTQDGLPITSSQVTVMMVMGAADVLAYYPFQYDEFQWGLLGLASLGQFGNDTARGGAPSNSPPCLKGAGPLLPGQSRCAPSMPKGSNLISTDCNKAIPAINGTYNVPGAPADTAPASWNNLPPGGYCTPRRPGFNCYAWPEGNGCTLTFCAPYKVQVQQLAPGTGIYIPKGANLPQMSEECVRVIP